MKPSNKIVAIIPARGGSKGIPRKNATLVAGKPMLAWNIETAKASRFVEDVYVSTNDDEIADIARQYGAKVIERPEELAGDTATSESALVHALNELKGDGVEPDFLVFMQCTSPLTSTEDVDAAVRKILDEKADSCLTVTDAHHFLWKTNEEGSAVGINHDQRVRPRRQDIEPEYAENGAVYVMKVLGFLEANHRFFGKTVMSVMPKERSFDVDTELDLKMAEALLKSQRVLGSALNHQGLMPHDRAPKAILFDFDGVFTNNKVYVDEIGRESVRCDRSDGWGLAQLKKSGVKIAVLSTETNPVVSTRCEKLGIECRQGLGEKKINSFETWCAQNQIEPEDVVFVGNDANDVDCLKAAGCGVVPADAYADAIRVADKVLSRNGGEGAVRELCEIVLNFSN